MSARYAKRSVLACVPYKSTALVQHQPVVGDRVVEPDFAFLGSSCGPLCLAGLAFAATSIGAGTVGSGRMRAVD